MEGGRIRVRGNAGDYLGSNIDGGTIIVEKNAGNNVGINGNREKIVIKGKVGNDIGEGALFWFGEEGNEATAISLSSLSPLPTEILDYMRDRNETTLPSLLDKLKNIDDWDILEIHIGGEYGSISSSDQLPGKHQFLLYHQGDLIIDDRMDNLDEIE